MSEPLKRGDLVGKGGYKLLSSLGTGGFGEVWLAQGAEAGLVAVKVVDTSVWSKKEYRVFNAMMVSEASFLSTLDHPGVPSLKAFFAEGTRYFLVMDWVQGQTLEERVELDGPLELSESLSFLSSLCGILEYLHHTCSPPVVFGDIKPANVLLAKDGSWRLVDLGLAARVGTRLTGTFAVFSPDYSAPERVQGEASVPAHDVYAMAATFVYALSGRIGPPGPALERSVRHAFREGAAHWGEEARRELSKVYSEIVRCLNPSAEQRVRSVRPLSACLQRWSEAHQAEQGDTGVTSILSSLYSAEKKDPELE